MNQIMKYHNVQLFQPSRRNASLQFHYIYDFDWNPVSHQFDKKGHITVVLIFRIKTALGPRLISCCRDCEDSRLSMFSVYMAFDWSTTSTDLPSMNMVFSCKHKIAVLSFLIVQNALHSMIDVTSSFQDIDILSLLLDTFINVDDSLPVNSFYLPEELNLLSRFGKSKEKTGCLGIFISEAFDVLLVTIWISDRTNSPKIFCWDCPRSTSCRHSRKIHPNVLQLHPYVISQVQKGRIPLKEVDLSEEEGEDEAMGNTNGDNKSSTKKKYGATILSKRRYPDDIRTDSQLANHISSRLQIGIPSWCNVNLNAKHFICETKRCCNADTEHFNAWKDATLFTLNGFFLGYVVTKAICTICNKTYFFDGRDLGIINYGNRKLFTVEFFYELMRMKINGGFPTSAFWKTKIEINLMCYNDHPAVNQLRKSWSNLSGRIHSMLTQFLQLIDYDKKIFQCCENPAVLCIDGIVLSTNNDEIQAQNLTQPWLNQQAILRERFSLRKERELISFTDSQKLIMADFIKKENGN